MSYQFYPTSPASLPDDLTKLPSSYHLKATLAILGVIIFFGLYAVMVYALAHLVIFAITYDMIDVNRLTIVLKIGAIAGSVMLFIFTLKFIFKLKNHQPKNRIKLKKDEHPELWNFILQICKETGAPKPKNIYVDPDVNAYVAYSNMWLSLFLPVRKELTIGLGLTSGLNLSEFKAVMTHEFGHFSQRSMKIGSYIMSANTIIHGMIFSRDKWDEILEQWRASDIRLSAAAWIITPVIWTIRQVLKLFYQFLNIMYSSLSREMEFNADKIAVSTSGSDAIISGLWKLDGAAQNWNDTINNAYLASQKKIHVKNLYTHYLLALERLAPKTKKAYEQLPEDKRGGKQFFNTSETSKAGMYASHPPNDRRENNAKVPYVECPEDNRSPWILFGNTEKLQEEMTELVYDQYINKKSNQFATTEEFEEFIIAENADKELLEEYLNTFKDRYLNTLNDSELRLRALNIANPINRLEELKEELVQLMKPVKDLEELMVTAQQIATGTTKLKHFNFEGKKYSKKNLDEGFRLVHEQREKLFNESFKEWDYDFCAVHVNLANKINKQDELINLYQQHAEISKIFRHITQVKNEIISELNQIQAKGEVTPNEVNTFGERVNELATSSNKFINNLDLITFVPLPNIENLDVLKKSLVEGGVFTRQSGPIFENGGFEKIMNQIENSIMHCQRIDQKSIGFILKTHHELQEAKEEPIQE